MRLIDHRGQIALVVVIACLGSAEVFGQGVPSSSGSPGSTRPPTAALMNPYLNPYMNPYLNPAATQQTMSASDAMLYLYAAQASGGGIGSGIISGTRPTPGRTRALDKPVSTAVPGGGASGYFNPGPVNVNGAVATLDQDGASKSHFNPGPFNVNGAGRYFNRRSPRRGNNGR